MSKRLIMICAAVMAIAFAIPAFAAVQNVKVSGDVTASALNRFNFALGSTDVNCGGKQNLLFSIARVRVDAELTDNVAVVMRLLNERVWDAEISANGNVNSNVDLDLAYATLKEFLYSPLTLTAGRQELHFGNDLVIGDVDTNGYASAASPLTTTAGTLSDLGDLSARKAFDAIRGTLDYVFADQPLTVDMVYAKIDENTNNRNDDVSLYGANANYAVNDNLLAEAYFWLRERKVGATGNTLGINDGNVVQPARNERLHTIGTRAVYTGVDNLTLQGEAAYQGGTRIWSTVLNPNSANNPNRLANSLLNVDAWALQLMADYVFDGVRNNPTLGLSYTYLSGDKVDDSKNYKGWDAMYENQAGGTIFNKILGYSNANFINVNASIKPDFIDDLTLRANYYNLQLDKALAISEAAVIVSGISGGQSYRMTSKKDLGNEVDVDLIYDYTEDVQLGLNLGWFVPGDAFAKVNRDTATQAIASMKVTF